jgi:uncharacterized protein affecting Mg2+/Co2+ transport
MLGDWWPCRTLDSQRFDLPRQRSHLGLFGSVGAYEKLINFRFLPYSMILAFYLVKNELNEHIQRAQQRREKQRRTSASAPSSGAGAPVSPVTTTLAQLDILDGFDVVTIIAYSHVSDDERMSIDAAGRVVRRMADASLYVVAPSFIEYLEQYATDLESGMFAATLEHGILRFPLHHATGSECVTRGIRISVGVVFVPERSTAGESHFCYQVRIAHDESTTVRATLVSRHWEVTSMPSGKVDIVDGQSRARCQREQTRARRQSSSSVTSTCLSHRCSLVARLIICCPFRTGPGVIGETPSMSPGCAPFSYESRTGISGASGSMRGHFTFRIDGSDEHFDAIINPFVLDPKRNYC